MMNNANRVDFRHRALKGGLKKRFLIFDRKTWLVGTALASALRLGTKCGCPHQSEDGFEEHKCS